MPLSTIDWILHALCFFKIPPICCKHVLYYIILIIYFIRSCASRQFATLLTRFIADKSAIKQIKMAAGVLLAIHFVLNPYLNVLHHWKLVKSTCSRPKNINASGGSASGSRSVSLRMSYKVSTPPLL